ncbi:hypothetical protein QTP88_020456 [Uroleucon formosanum]
MVRNKVRENRYYWECEKRFHRKTLETTENCTARATTDCVNGVHKLRSTPPDHNHISAARRATLIDFRSDFKKRAQSIRDKPLQILQGNVWRKIQSCGLATEYCTDENFRLQLRYIPTLTFLEPNEILAAFNEIKQYIPIEIYSWFDETFVNGKFCRTFRNGTISRFNPSFHQNFGQ